MAMGVWAAGPPGERFVMWVRVRGGRWRRVANRWDSVGMVRRGRSARMRVPRAMAVVAKMPRPLAVVEAGRISIIGVLRCWGLVF
jgi:hypothetical protein